MTSLSSKPRITPYFLLVKDKNIPNTVVVMSHIHNLYRLSAQIGLLVTSNHYQREDINLKALLL